MDADSRARAEAAAGLVRETQLAQQRAADQLAERIAALENKLGSTNDDPTSVAAARVEIDRLLGELARVRSTTERFQKLEREYQSSVLYVHASYMLRKGETTIRRSNVGSAFFVTERGHLITNKHVVKNWLFQPEDVKRRADGWTVDPESVRYAVWPAGREVLRADGRLDLDAGYSTARGTLSLLDTAVDRFRERTRKLASGTSFTGRFHVLDQSDLAVLVAKVDGDVVPLPLAPEDHVIEKLDPVMALGFPAAISAREPRLETAPSLGEVRKVEATRASPAAWGGSYRYASTHSETALLKRMVGDREEDRLSLILPPGSSVGFDVSFDDEPRLMFGVLPCSPLGSAVRDAEESRPPTTLRVEFETPDGRRTVLLEEAIGGRTKAWRERVISSAKVDGATITGSGRLRFATSGSPGGWIIAIGDPRLEPRDLPRGPSLIILTVDSLRPDFIGPDAKGHTNTPYLDAFRAEGTSVSDAITAGLNTYAAIPGFMASLPDASAGAAGFGLRLAVDHRTLADVLRHQGYLVHGVVPDFYMNSFLKGFYRRSRVTTSPGPGEDDHRRVALALRFLEARADRSPFFLWLHLDDPHTPWLPDVPSDVPWDAPGAVDPGGPIARFSRAAAIVDDPRAGGDLSAWARRYLRRCYVAEVRRADRLVGRVLAQLDAVGRADDTLVVVHGDHGLEFAGPVGGRTLGEGTIRVPLSFRFPGRVPAGVERTGVFAFSDLAPTITSLLGVRPDARWWGRDRSDWLRAQDTKLRSSREIAGVLESGESATDHPWLRDGWTAVRYGDQAVVRALGHRWERGVDAASASGRLSIRPPGALQFTPVGDPPARVCDVLDRILERALTAGDTSPAAGPLSSAMKGFLRKAGYLPDEAPKKSGKGAEEKSR